MMTKDTNWYVRPPIGDSCKQMLFINFLLVPSYTHVVFSFFIGKLPKGILCILTNVTTSKQRRLLQDTVKHGHSTCTRGHTGECRNSNNLNFKRTFVGNGFDGAIVFCIAIME